MTDGGVDRDAPLTTLGLDSLMTVELINRVERQVGLRIPMGMLLSGPSIKDLTQAMLRLLVPLLSAVDEASETAMPVDRRPASSPHDTGHVVPLRTGGHRPPVVAFHPVGGGLGIYATLPPPLPADLPLYRLESRPMA